MSPELTGIFLHAPVGRLLVRITCKPLLGAKES